MKAKGISVLLLASIASGSSVATAADKAADKRQIDRGRYLATIGGCNDCHTPHYMERDGRIPEAEWLTGSAMGFQGPWGTTYPANLRLIAQNMTEAQWIARARAPMRPPMPWFNLAKMSDADLRFFPSRPTPALLTPVVSARKRRARSTTSPCASR